MLRVLGGVLRGSASVFESIGVSLQGSLAHVEKLNNHSRWLKHKDAAPAAANTAFVAPNASVIGRVTIGANSSVWHGAILRGDVNAINVGSNVCIDDSVMVHCEGMFRQNPTVIADDVVVETGATLHGCTVERGARIGAGATVGNGATVGAGAIVAPGSVVTDGVSVPAGSYWAGVPARAVRQVTETESAATAAIVQKRVLLAQKHSVEHARSADDREQAAFDAKYIWTVSDDDRPKA